MRQLMVRYRVKPDQAATNEQLVRAVYSELHRTEPSGLRYATFQLDEIAPGGRRGTPRAQRR